MGKCFGPKALGKGGLKALGKFGPKALEKGGRRPWANLGRRPGGPAISSAEGRSSHRLVHENSGTDRMMNTDVTAPKTQGGTQSKRVTGGLYPMVATMVGKKIPYVTPISTNVPAIASHHTVQSVRASTRPSPWTPFCSISPRSSSILFRASNCSSAVSHDAGVLGKSGMI